MSDKARMIKDLMAGKVAMDSEVVIEGWVRTRRDSKAGLSFIHVSDGTCFSPIQVVAESKLDNYDTEVKRITSGCAIRVTGKLVASQGKNQTCEVQADKLEVVGWVEDPDSYPIQPKPHSREFLREVAHLRPRTQLFGAMARVRHCLSMAIHDFFNRRQFYWVHTPLITGSDCEGAGDMFRVSTLDFANIPRNDKGEVDFSQDFFGRPAHLTVSGQLNVETYATALTRVYTFGPTFRAENSNTRRHLSEFWMVEPEIAFADLHDDAMLAWDFLKHIFKAVLDERGDDMAFFAQFVDKGCIERLESLVNSNLTMMSYTEAVDRLSKSGEKFDFPVFWGMDMQTEHERCLTEKIVKGPVAVVDYPKDIKAFYMRMNDDNKTVAAMDVLVPGIGEMIGGSQREERLDMFDKRLDELKLDKEAYSWYRDLRRYGTVPHAGFGLGFERAMMYATGLDNIRDVIPFPRAPRQIAF
ncbi:MAG: asparagine--tRNA ligase [Proteobacteria bacterium]|nr:asparagine--tRNA ligase [Pseudomonadota bacterium]